MKTLFRILIVGAFVAIIIYFIDFSEGDKILEGPITVVKPISDTKAILPNSSIERPKEGISTLVGQSTDQLIKTYGEPNYKYETIFTYDLWIYNNLSNYIVVGVKNEKINQIYTNSESLDVTPYKLNIPASDIYASTILDAEITVKIDDNIYILSMSEDDTLNRILVKLDTIYAQLYIDEITEKLIGVRFLDGATLVENQPYEMQFMGDLIESPVQSSHILLETHKYNAQQLKDLINVFRKKYYKPILLSNEKLDYISETLSEKRFNLEINELAIDHKELQQYLDDYEIQYEKVEESVAVGYIDPIETIHGLLNSNTHREIILNNRFNYFGIGVYDEYYTQIFLKNEIE